MKSTANMNVMITKTSAIKVNYKILPLVMFCLPDTGFMRSNSAHWTTMNSFGFQSSSPSLSC